MTRRVRAGFLEIGAVAVLVAVILAQAWVASARSSAPEPDQPFEPEALCPDPNLLECVGELTCERRNAKKTVCRCLHGTLAPARGDP